jgi:hypothetical protein
MPNVGEQADIFRALGRFLDDQGAKRIQIQAREVVLQVTFAKTGPQEHIAVAEHDLDSLREQAKAMRQGSGGSPAGSLAEIMRTLGQELDEGGIEANGITQEDDGFRVSGVSGGRYTTEFFSNEDLASRSTERREMRGAAPAPTRIDPYTLVEVGLAVVTQDDQRVGKVGELRGRHFRVEAPMLQRDFWLPAECVADVHPGEHVLLTTNRSQLEPFKSRIPPAR